MSACPLSYCARCSPSFVECVLVAPLMHQCSSRANLPSISSLPRKAQSWPNSTSWWLGQREPSPSSWWIWGEVTWFARSSHLCWRTCLAGLESSRELHSWDSSTCRLLADPWGNSFRFVLNHTFQRDYWEGPPQRILNSAVAICSASGLFSKHFLSKVLGDPQIFQFQGDFQVGQWVPNQ